MNIFNALRNTPNYPTAVEDIKPSHYQEAIFDFVRNPYPVRPDGIVNAKAGSGKTWSLTNSARLVKGRGLFLAFNKHIASTLVPSDDQNFKYEALIKKLEDFPTDDQITTRLGYGFLSEESPWMRCQATD